MTEYCDIEIRKPLTNRTIPVLRLGNLRSTGTNWNCSSLTVRNSKQCEIHTTMMLVLDRYIQTMNSLDNPPGSWAVHILHEYKRRHDEDQEYLRTLGADLIKAIEGEE